MRYLLMRVPTTRARSINKRGPRPDGPTAARGARRGIETAAVHPWCDVTSGGGAERSPSTRPMDEEVRPTSSADAAERDAGRRAACLSPPSVDIVAARLDEAAKGRRQEQQKQGAGPKGGGRGVFS